MNRTATFIVGSLVGLIIGGVLTFYLFVGVPRAAIAPGNPILPPDAGGTPPATAQIVLKQDFFNEVLKSIFRDMSAPSFPLSLTESRNSENSSSANYAMLQDGGCDGRITLLPEGSGVQSVLKFENGKINAPLAFRGSYNSMFGCLNFSGWTQANLELRFDAAQQTVLGQLNIETVNLDGGASVFGGIVTPLVQKTLNDRVNPIQILQGKQIALNLPIAATNGNMKADVKDVRAEVKDNALNLYVIYEFNGKNTNQTGF
ncbi:MAG TPA: hypothetical protein VNB22_20515 [Pyrinomonadaceae bacterium]|jgi:hypothetical protein|nr:hypothetical protein [Pyrinomonadaceae bacterium]